MPYAFMMDHLAAAPTIVRPLRPPRPGKAKDFLALARIMARRFPSDSSGRAAEWLLSVVRDTNAGQAPEIPWFTMPVLQPVVRVAPIPLAATLVPSVELGARFLGAPRGRPKGKGKGRRGVGSEAAFEEQKRHIESVNMLSCRKSV